MNDAAEVNLNGPEPAPETKTPEPAAASLKNERMWGTFCHLSALAGFLGIPTAIIIGPLMVWILKKDQSAYIHEQGKEAVNFQFTMALAGVAALLICIFHHALGLVLLLGVVVVDFVFVIIAALRANRGELYQYPLTIRFIK